MFSFETPRCRRILFETKCLLWDGKLAAMPREESVILKEKMHKTCDVLCQQCLFCFVSIVYPLPSLPLFQLLIYGQWLHQIWILVARIVPKPSRKHAWDRPPLGRVWDDWDQKFYDISCYLFSLWKQCAKLFLWTSHDLISLEKWLNKTPDWIDQQIKQLFPFAWPFHRSPKHSEVTIARHWSNGQPILRWETLGRSFPVKCSLTSQRAVWVPEKACIEKIREQPENI